jgi:membrane-associated phospholipid phosphatase
MRRYLLVALWPAGIAAIAAATAVAARRAPVSPARTADDLATSDPATPGSAVDEPARQEDTGPAGRHAGQAGTDGVRTANATPAPAPADWVWDLIRLGAISYAGGFLSYKVMESLGSVVVNQGPVIDERIVRWTDSHQVTWWAAVMERLGKIGNTWTTWGAAGTAAVCLGVTWRRQRWLPPTVLGAAIIVDHYATLAIRHRFGRPGPPDSPGGTYPSGGCDRVVLVYGLIADMLWREFSGNPRARAWATGTVAALSFNEAYSRGYLSKHWFTDIVSGLFYGALLLGPFLAAVRLIAGPARGRGRPVQARTYL